MTVWRISPRAYLDVVREGRGGLYAAGRWHERGLPVIYTSENPATALLELLVNASATKLVEASYRLLKITIPDDGLRVVADEELHSDWRAHPHSDFTRRLGSEWLTEGNALALNVPSAVFPIQRNVILNPVHTRMSDVEFGAPRPLELDERLVRRTRA